MTTTTTITAKIIHGDLVLDPFSGSGTALVAAAELGRRSIGIDLSPDFCDVARGRLRAAVSTSRTQRLQVPRVADAVARRANIPVPDHETADSVTASQRQRAIGVAPEAFP